MDKPDDELKKSINIPYALMPIYLALILQFIGVVWFTSGLYQTVIYQTSAIQALQVEVKKLVEDGIPNRLTVSEAQKEFQKRDDVLRDYILTHKAEVERHLVTLEDLKARVQALELNQRKK